MGNKEIGKKVVGSWMNLNFRVSYYRNLIMFVILLILGIIFFLISIFVFFISLKWGLILLVISVVLFGLSWFAKVCANRAKKIGKKVQEDFGNL